MWNILIVTGLGLLSVASAYLGCYVALIPARNGARKRLYVRSFVAIGVVSVSLVFIVAKRTSGVSRKVEYTLSSVKTKTFVDSSHAHLQINEPVTDPFPFRVGQMPNSTIQLCNNGDGSLREGAFQIMMVLASLPTQHSEDTLFASLKQRPFIPSGSLDVLDVPCASEYGARSYSIALDEPLTADDVARLNDGFSSLCAMGRFLWTDDTGQYQTSYFRCLYKTFGSNVATWNLVGERYNREIPHPYDVRNPQ